MEWFVVTTDGKVAVKGNGTVNGATGYGFDDPDHLRLVVWSLADGSYPGDKTLYDNRRDGNYDLDLSKPQVLTSGSVQVHN